MAQRTGRVVLLDILSLLESGHIAIAIDGQPLLSVRSEQKELEFDINGAKKAGLALTSVIKSTQSDANILMGVERIAGKLSLMGWRGVLYDGDNEILVMGRGVSRLTGHISTNPLKLARLLKAIR